LKLPFCPENWNPQPDAGNVAVPDIPATAQAGAKLNKIRIPPQAPVAPAPTRVQPSRQNRGSRMAMFINNMEVDDDAANPRRKRKADDEPSEHEDLAAVPQDAPQNPMAPAPPTKKRKQRNVGPAMAMPLSMPLQAPMPVQARPPVVQSSKFLVQFTII
jgi:hypothetical protein